jgi:hypothetical protein
MTSIQPATNLPQTQFTQLAAEAVRNDVFISYSRKDKAFVEALAAAFQQRDRDPWVDWDDIRKGEEWWAAIQRGIEAADTFVFVLSPDSVASAVCRDEVEHAAKHNKRFLPIVWREGFEMQRVHPAISSHNWLFFRETDDFDRAFTELLEAMETDLDYVRAHTRLLVRAIEWQQKGRDDSYLLRGNDLQDSAQWLTLGVGKTPQPTVLQSDYICNSLDAAARQQKARQKAKWIVVLTTVLANMALAIAGGYWFFHFVTERTTQELEDNLVRSLQTGLIGIDGNEFVALTQINALPGQEPFTNPLYRRHQIWLTKVQTVFPNATLRTYIPSRNPNQLIRIGDVGRALKSRSTGFRQAAPARPADLQIFDGVTEKVVTTIPYSDESGRWVSANGPIKTPTGQVVGGLKVYLRETYVQQVQGEVQRNLWIAYLFIFVWLLVLSLLILRATRPPDRLNPRPDRPQV